LHFSEKCEKTGIFEAKTVVFDPFLLFFNKIDFLTFFFLKEKSCKKEAKNLRFYRL
jgi:hypothetical protein